ncbi:MAG TPA: hypothetical protein DCP26_07800 [Brevundimonas sp.]|nr:hypothetical protein [Brevundimonas sp.]
MAMRIILKLLFRVQRFPVRRSSLQPLPVAPTRDQRFNGLADLSPARFAGLADFDTVIGVFRGRDLRAV